MNIKDLVIFHTVANCGSINRAAKELNYVQSNVTSRIQKLEESLNTKLFFRHQRGITLTNEGEAMLPYAKKVISLVDEMKQIATDSDNPSGKIDIASVETVIKLPYILSAYLNKHQLVDLTLSTGVTAELKEKVLNYQLDGAFVTKSEITNDSKLNEIEVFQEKLVLIANEDNLSMDELLERPILRFSEGCGYRSKLNEWLADEKIIPKKVMELGTIETTLGSVMSGLGIAYVPYAAVENYVGQNLIYSYELPEKYSLITTIFIYRAAEHYTPALKKFFDTIKQVRAEQQA